jgi:hypothetical protein
MLWAFVGVVIAIVALSDLFGARALLLILLFVLAVPVSPVAAFVIAGNHRVRHILPFAAAPAGALIAMRVLSPKVTSALFGATVAAALVQAILATSPEAARRAGALDEGTHDRRLAIATFVLVAAVGIRPAFVDASAVRLWLPSLVAVALVFAGLFAMETTRYVRLRRIYRGHDPELHVGAVERDAPPLFHDVDTERALRTAGSEHDGYRVVEGHALCGVPASFSVVTARLVPRLVFAAAGTSISIWALLHSHPW